MKIALLDNGYDVASSSSVQGALASLGRGEHDILFVNANDLSRSLPGLFAGIARRPRALGVLIDSERPEELTRAFADLADGSLLGGSPVGLLRAAPQPHDLLGASRRLQRKLRWRRATGELEAIDVNDGRVWR